MKKPNLFLRFLYLINFILALALLGSYSAWFVNPSNLPIAGVMSLLVPILMVANASFFIFWLFFYKRFLWLSLICLLLGWWHWPGIVQFNGHGNQIEPSAFTAMSYNVHNYYANHPRGLYVDVEKMEALVNDANPDFLCLQEFQNARKWVPREKLKHKFLSKNRSGQLAIFSAFPFVNKGETKYSVQSGGYGKFIWADVKIGDDTLRIINVHLASIGLENDDLRTFANIDEADEESVTKSGENIFVRLKNAFAVRGNQANDLSTFVAESPHPILLCGDFNDPPSSFAYRKISNLLNDSFTTAGAGFGGTHAGFAAKSIPLRIDYIFTSPKYKAAYHQVIEENYSDHFAVMARFVDAEN